MKQLLTCLTLLLVVTMTVAAQEGLSMYLTETDNIKARMDQTRSGFSKAMTPKNKAGDIAGTQALSKEYVVVWLGFREELGQIQPPKEAYEYHKILALVVNLQLESCISVREFTANILEGKAKVASLKAEEASEETIQAYLDEQSEKNKKVVEQLGSFKKLIPDMDRALAQKRQALND